MLGVYLTAVVMLNQLFLKFSVNIYTLNYNQGFKMQNEQKQNYYLVSVIFKTNASGGLVQHASIIQHFTSKIINNSLMNEMKISFENVLKTKEENQGISDLQITSISYLGEMTETEFNS